MNLYELYNHDSRWRKFFNGSAVFMPCSYNADRKLCELLNNCGLKVCGSDKYNNVDGLCRCYGSHEMFQTEYSRKEYYEQIGKTIFVYCDDGKLVPYEEWSLVKKMTIKEIQDVLGYKIEIVE